MKNPFNVPIGYGYPIVSNLPMDRSVEAYPPGGFGTPASASLAGSVNTPTSAGDPTNLAPADMGSATSQPISNPTFVSFQYHVSTVVNETWNVDVPPGCDSARIQAKRAVYYSFAETPSVTSYHGRAVDSTVYCAGAGTIGFCKPMPGKVTITFIFRS